MFCACVLCPCWSRAVSKLNTSTQHEHATRKRVLAWCRRDRGFEPRRAETAARDTVGRLSCPVFVSRVPCWSRAVSKLNTSTQHEHTTRKSEQAWCHRDRFRNPASDTVGRLSCPVFVSRVDEMRIFAGWSLQRRGWLWRRCSPRCLHPGGGGSASRAFDGRGRVTHGSLRRCASARPLSR